VNRERSREGGCLIAGNLHLLDGDLTETPGAPAMISPRLPGGDDEQERGSGVESEWATGGDFQRDPWVLFRGMRSVYGGAHRTRLDGKGGFWGRCCEPVSGDTQVALVAGWCGYSGGGFRDAASKTVCDAVDSVHHGARQGWRRGGVTVPCRRARSAGLGEVAAHGNGVHALDALGGQVASYRHGWPAVHGGSRGFLLQGIDPLVRDGAGGEVTGLGTVGGALPRLGCPWWSWRRQ
jgi:hypothetical protein